MTEEQKESPKAFVSYSWSSPEHVARIMEWAERLMSDGVNVTLDKWDLREGQDKNAFMEKMVTDPSISKVLVFSDKRYAERSDKRAGGVGTESQIISQEVYEKVDQEKFLPIVCEFDEKGSPYLPVFLKSRIYFDFSSVETFHDNYERLIRAIYGKPLFKRPISGKPPDYILADNKPALWSKPILQNFREAVLAGKSHYAGYATTFLDTFFERLEDFRIEKTSEKYIDDQVVESIESFMPFRDDFIEFLTVVITYKGEPELYERIGDFFERSLYYKGRPENLQSWNEGWFDNFRFILYELFLCLIALLIKNRKYAHVSMYLEKLYYLPKNFLRSDATFAWYPVFSAHCDTLQARNQRLQLNRISLIADFMHQRATNKHVPFDHIMQAEAVLFLRNLIGQDGYDFWYPHTLVYAQHSRTFELFARAASRKEFERIKVIFGVATKNELLEKSKSGSEKFGIARWTAFNFYARVDFNHIFGLEKMDTV